MIKIKHDHFYGSQEKHDIQLTRLSLDTTDLNETEALENGWLLFNNKWYSCRSVRIDISKFHTKKYLPDTFETQFTIYDLDPIKKIYKEYIEYKKFEESYDIFTDMNRSIWMIVRDEGRPVAFTKFIKYKDGLESQFSAWNYHKPKLSVGKLMIIYEVWYAKALGLDYLYIGQGYESGSLYKTTFPGFQWWTGEQWSEDTSVYKQLCSRDSTINTLDDLAKAYNDAQT